MSVFLLICHSLHSFLLPAYSTSVFLSRNNQKFKPVTLKLFAPYDQLSYRDTCSVLICHRQCWALLRHWSLVFKATMWDLMHCPRHVEVTRVGESSFKMAGSSIEWTRETPTGWNWNIYMISHMHGFPMHIPCHTAVCMSYCMAVIVMWHNSRRYC